MAKKYIYKNFLGEEVEKRFTKEYDEKWGIYLSDNLTGNWYNINPSRIVDTCNQLWEQVIQLKEENTALDNENAEHLADNIRELELLEKLTKFLHECGLTDEQRALFRDMITEDDLQPNL